MPPPLFPLPQPIDGQLLRQIRHFRAAGYAEVQAASCQLLPATASTAATLPASIRRDHFRHISLFSYRSPRDKAPSAHATCRSPLVFPLMCCAFLRWQKMICPTAGVASPYKVVIAVGFSIFHKASTCFRCCSSFITAATFHSMR